MCHCLHGRFPAGAQSILHQGFVTIQFIFQQNSGKHVTTIAEKVM